jgi:hypothetical protein
VAKQLTWSDDGLSTTDGKYVIGAVHATDGQPVLYFWTACPLLKTADGEVVEDDRPHGCDTLDEMHAQADAMNRGRQALVKFEAPRAAARHAGKAQRRQDAEDAQLDEFVAKLLDRPGFAEKLAEKLGGR